MGYKNWRTPAGEGEVFDILDNEFRFTMDAAATPVNRLCRRFCTEAGKFEVEAGSLLGYKPIGHFEPYDDFLGGSDVRHWYDERVWWNPPYDVINPWVATAKYGQSTKLVPVSVGLLPPSVDTEWYRSLFRGQQKSYKFVETDHYTGFKTLNERFEHRIWKYRIRFLRPKNLIRSQFGNDDPQYEYDESDPEYEYDESDPESVVGESPRAGNLVVVHRA